MNICFKGRIETIRAGSILESAEHDIMIAYLSFSTILVVTDLHYTTPVLSCVKDRQDLTQSPHS